MQSDISEDLRYKYIERPMAKVVSEFLSNAEKIRYIVNNDNFNKKEFLNTISSFVYNNQIFQGSLDIIKGVKYILDETGLYETAIIVGHFQIYDYLPDIIDIYLSIDGSVNCYNYFKRKYRLQATLIPVFKRRHLDKYSVCASPKDKDLMFFAITNQSELEYLRQNPQSLAWTNDLIKYLWYIHTENNNKQQIVQRLPDKCVALETPVKCAEPTLPDSNVNDIDEEEKNIYYNIKRLFLNFYEKQVQKKIKKSIRKSLYILNREYKLDITLWNKDILIIHTLDLHENIYHSKLYNAHEYFQQFNQHIFVLD